MTQDEFDAGDGQVIVMYSPEDIGAEIEPRTIFAAIAEDSARRARDGIRIVSTSVVPVRHSGAVLGRQGSGFETKVSIVVVYAPLPK